MALPRIANCPLIDDLITTDLLRGAYARASVPELRETATRPLFEQLLNEFFSSDYLGVYGEQQLDPSQQAVDIALGFFDRQPLPNLVFVLLAETKRHKVKDRGELESQLEEYGDRYLSNEDWGGLAIHHTVYGATAYGTKIRFFRFTRENGDFEPTVFSGQPRVPAEGAYWDVKTDGRKIIPVLQEIWQLRQELHKITGA